MTPKLYWTLQGQMYPLHGLSLVYHYRFRVTGHFETRTLNDPRREDLEKV